jgi:hypothetical protein
MTRSHVFFAEGSSVHRVMDFSGSSTPPSGNQPATGHSTPQGHNTPESPDQSNVSPETATGTTPTGTQPGGVKDVSATGTTGSPGAGGAPGSPGVGGTPGGGGSLGGGPSALTSSGGGGTLPFTGADLALEATAGAGAVGAGALLRRFLRKRRT